MYPAQKQLDTRTRELIEEINEITVYLDDLEEHDGRSEIEPPKLSC